MKMDLGADQNIGLTPYCIKFKLLKTIIILSDNLRNK